ncbi:MAG: hypothetical protein LH467_15035 [Gemmatimonadaceae bacterium]|nr:hypothetical protein [Gemmatimonadaceae bacterium]
MARLINSRPAAHMFSRRRVTARLTALTLLSLGLLASSGTTASAQFGGLKRLKELKDAVSKPDSAAKAKEALEKLQHVSNGEVGTPIDTSTRGPGLFSRARSAVVGASDKFEKVTGVSTKDAVLAASGAGLAGIAAKKMGVDPASLAGNALGKANELAQKKAALSRAGSSPGAALKGALTGAPNAAGMQQMQAMQQQMQALQAMQGKAMSASTRGIAGLVGMPDAQLMLTFQQEMMQVAMDATTGNAVARAKLDAWNTLTDKYDADAMALSVAASGGDMAALAKMQAMQVGMMREWLKLHAKR